MPITIKRSSMDSNRFNQILVIDSIPTGEYNTARRLFEDIETYANAYSPSPPVKYVRVENGDEFIQCLQNCSKDAIEKHVIPMLHIECHGFEDGFQFADGSLAYWEELKLPITELNIATRLNLMVAVAACTGGALAKLLQISDRAPFWGLIGPTQDLTARELEKAYRTFYLTLLSHKSPTKAVQAMDGETKPGQFLRTTSRGLFEKVWAGYKKEHCNPSALELRAIQIRKHLEQAATLMLPTLDELKSQLICHEPVAYSRYWRTFFMCDLFPEHSNRFSLEQLG